MNKKKILIIAGIVLILLIVATVIVVVKSSSSQIPEESRENNVISQNVKVTGKLAEYINSLTENYYIKYSGNFKNNSGELVNAIVEYTKEGQNYGLRSSEISMHMICEGEKLYSISNRYKIIVEMSKNSFDISEYNLASDIGQTYVKSYKEKINNTEYAVEEYTFNGKTLKYYFKDNDIKLIKYDGQDIKIIRLENQTNTELLVKPSGYAYAIT